MTYDPMLEIFHLRRVKRPEGLKKLDEQPMRVGRYWVSRYADPQGRIYERIRESSGAVSWWRAEQIGEGAT
jgi:hypothetical protein